MHHSQLAKQTLAASPCLLEQELTVKICLAQAAADHTQDCSAQVFSRLSAAQPQLDSNRTSIATVLASPLLVEYETDKLKQAGKVSLVIGATVLMCFLPLVGMGALAGEALAASAAFATISTPVLYLGAGTKNSLLQLQRIAAACIFLTHDDCTTVWVMTPHLTLNKIMSLAQSQLD